MAAPTTTPRGTGPAGIKLDDGFSTVVRFAADPTAALWAKSVTIPGMDGGDAIDTTTMENTTWRTMASRALVTLTEGSFTAAYDPVVYSELLALLNVETSVTVHFPDGSTLDFWGYLRVFEAGELVEGEQPEATVTLQPTNQDPTTGSEEPPVLTSVAGT